MRSLTVALLLSLPAAGHGSARAQVGDVAASQDTALVDSALVAYLQSEVDWRHLIRVRTEDTWMQLLRPSVSALGIDYEKLSVIEGPAGGPVPPRPIPLSTIHAIEARKGNPKAGMIFGSVMGAAIVATVIHGLSQLEGGDGNVVAAVGVGIIIGGPVGALFGSFLGEALYSWQLVYIAASPPG